jgi:hypothetical protein
MRRMMVVLVLGVVTIGAGWSVPKGEAGAESMVIDVSTPAPQCVCYCKSEKKYPGATACMGGFLMQCRDDGYGKKCGWDNMKEPNNENKRCNGEC